MNMAKLPRMAFRNDPQLPFLERPEVKFAVAGMAIAGAESRGAVFTRREVVDFILDLADYTVDKPLHHARLLKPSMGQGDFLTPAIDRLFEVYAREVGKRGDIVKDLGDCITAVELHHASYEHARQLVTDMLVTKGVPAVKAKALCARWLKQGDFLLLPHEREFTHVIGNPPYVRQELIPDVLMANTGDSTQRFMIARISTCRSSNNRCRSWPKAAASDLSVPIAGLRTATAARCVAWSRKSTT